MSKEEDSATPATPAGPGLFVMGNTTGLPQQQRARGRIRRAADGSSAADGGQQSLGTVQDEETEEGLSTTGAARREANMDADASVTSSLLGTSSPFKRGS